MGCAQTSSKPKVILPETECFNTGVTVTSLTPTSLPPPSIETLMSKPMSSIASKPTKLIVTSDILRESPVGEDSWTVAAAREDIKPARAKATFESAVTQPISPQVVLVKPSEEPEPADQQCQKKEAITDSGEFIKVSPARRETRDEFEGVGSVKNGAKAGRSTVRVVFASLEPEAIEEEAMKSFNIETSSPYIVKPRILDLTTTVETGPNHKDSTTQENVFEKKPDRIPSTESLFVTNSGLFPAQSQNPHPQMESTKGTLIEDIDAR